MYKFAVLVVALMMVVAFIGCQQAGLSEEEVRSIVREEVTRQLGDVDTLTVSRVDIENDEGKVVATFGVVPSDGSGELRLYNATGENTVFLGDGGVFLLGFDGKPAIGLARIRGDYDSTELLLFNSDLALFNSDLALYRDREYVAYLGATSDGNGVLNLYDKYGQLTFVAP